MDREFYVYVSSENAPESIIKSIATNELPLSIDMVNKQWEVSLINTNISVSWYNVTDVGLDISKLYGDGHIERIQINLTPARYTKTDKLYTALNHAIEESLPESETKKNW